MYTRPLPLLLLVTLLLAATACLALPAGGDDLQVFAVRDQQDQAADNSGRVNDDVVVNPARDAVDFKDSDGGQDANADLGREGRSFWRGVVKWGSIILG